MFKRGRVKNFTFALFDSSNYHSKAKFFKKGAWEIEEIGKIAIAVLFLVVLVFVVIFLFKGGGGKILDTLKNMLRFGR